jgi:hypothetical protein
MRIAAEEPPEPPPPLPPWLQPLQVPFDGTTLIAVNVGGCLIPVCFSVYLMAHNPLPPGEVLAAVTIVSLVSYRLSRPCRGSALPCRSWWRRWPPR